MSSTFEGVSPGCWSSPLRSASPQRQLPPITTVSPQSAFVGSQRWTDIVTLNPDLESIGVCVTLHVRSRRSREGGGQGSAGCDLREKRLPGKVVGTASFDTLPAKSSTSEQPVRVSNALESFHDSKCVVDVVRLRRRIRQRRRPTKEMDGRLATLSRYNHLGETGVSTYAFNLNNACTSG